MPTDVLNFLSEYTEVFGVLVSVITALVAGAWVLIKHFNVSNDLVLSSLTDVNSKRLIELAGHKSFIGEWNQRIFPEGVRTELTLTYAGKGSNEISVRRMELEVVNYQDKNLVDHKYKVDGNAIIGAGTAKAHEFTVNVQGESVDAASWVLDEKLGKSERAKSDNFLDIVAINKNEDQYFKFNKDQQQEVIRGKVFSLKPGLYELRFKFYYDVNKKDKVLVSDSFFIYKQ